MPHAAYGAWVAFECQFTVAELAGGHSAAAISASEPVQAQPVQPDVAYMLSAQGSAVAWMQQGIELQVQQQAVLFNGSMCHWMRSQ